MKSHRKLDLAYLLLIPYAMLCFSQYLRMRIRFAYAIVFLFAWCGLVVLARRMRITDRKMHQYFINAIIPLSIFYVMRAYIFTAMSEFGELYPQLCTAFAMVIPIVILHYAILQNRIKELKIFSWVVLISMAGGALMFSQFDVGATRITATGITKMTMNDLMDRYEYMSSGAASYGQVYAMMVMIVFLIGDLFDLRRSMKRRRIIYFGLISVFLYGMYRAAYSYAWVALALGLVLVAVGWMFRLRSVSAKRVFFFICLAVILLVANQQLLSFMVEPLKMVAFSVESKDYQMRILSLIDSISGNEDAYAQVRANAYVVSWNAFLEFPFFGEYGAKLMGDRSWMNFRTGGHSYICDGLAYMGIIPYLFLVAGLSFFLRYISYVAHKFNVADRRLTLYYASFFATFAIATMNQLSSYEPYMMVYCIIPALMLPLDWEGNQYGNAYYPYPRF